MSAWEDPVFYVWLVTLGILLGFYLYVILIHSKKRWPNTTVHQRLVHITTMDGTWMREQDSRKPGE